MKKYFSLLLVAIFSFVLFSCDRTDNDTYSVVYDINRNFQYDATDGYYINESFNNPLFDSDVVLIYRRVGSTSGAPIWQQIPRTTYLTLNGNPEELDHDFDFSKLDIQIYLRGTMDISAQSQSFLNTYVNNQTFRVVIVPATQGKGVNIDYSDYYEVIKRFNIDDSNPTKL